MFKRETNHSPTQGRAEGYSFSMDDNQHSPEDTSSVLEEVIQLNNLSGLISLQQLDGVWIWIKNQGTPFE